jgi:hypothetical protein
MSIRETPQSRGATSRIGAVRRRAARAVLCTSAVAFMLAAFPALAGAFQPVAVGNPTATPTSDGAHLTATIYPYGLDTTYRYEYGTTTSYGSKIPVPDGDAGSASFPGTAALPQTITGLPSNTVFHFRLVATNSDGTLTSSDQTFMTTGPAVTPPAVVTGAASEIAGGFDLEGTVNPQGASTTYHFEYGTTTAYGTSVPSPDGSAGSGSTDVAVSDDVTELLANTTYHFRLVAHNSGGTMSGSDQTFTTSPSAPGKPNAAVNPAIANPPSGYKLEGEINPNGVETTYHFEYGTTTSYGTKVPVPDANIGEGTSSVPVFREVTGLAPNTTYHYRIVAENSKGTGTSQDRTFTTAPNPPVVVTTPFTETAGGFELNGTVNPNGGETTYHFLFGITEAYGAIIPEPDATVPGTGTSPVAVSQLVMGLPPNIPYHYRLVAENAGGVTMGGDQFFMTPPAKSIAPETPVQLLQPPLLPPNPPPTNQFTVRPATVKGTAATLQVSVPGPGTVSASGKQLRTVSAGSSGAGTVTLKLKLSSAGLKALKKARGHKLTVKVTIAFQPAGGSPGTTSRTVTFKK